MSVPLLFGIRPEFFIFSLILLGITLFHKRALEIVVAGLLILIFFKLIFDDSFQLWMHFFGRHQLTRQILFKGEREGEWLMILNLFGLLTGFAILAKLFESSRLPEKIPAILPDDWTGGLGLLIIVFVLSTFLDNIAAALIGGTMARSVFKGKVHLGFLAAIIAAANAGGAGSVLGDTTTTLMWIEGVSPLDVFHAFIASLSALVVFGLAASLQQDSLHRIRKDPPKHLKINIKYLMIVILILSMAIVTNLYFDFPALGVWAVISISSAYIVMPWEEIPKALKGSVFLVALVTAASLMPVKELPPASVNSTFMLGLLSAVFDNIPLTKICLDQGGYDWGILAYSVGFGGSMLWFGSSAGVALATMFPEIRDTTNYVKKGWHLVLAYVVGFAVVLASVGWQPHSPHRPDYQNIPESSVIPEIHNKSK